MDTKTAAKAKKPAKATPDPVEQAADIKAHEPAVEAAPAAKPAVKRGVYVYLPDDEGDTVNYNGDPVPIGPGSTEIKPRGVHTAKVIAEHVATKLRDWGACVTSGPVTGGKASVAEDQATVDAAQLRYLTRTKKWAEDLILEAHAKTAPLIAAGIVTRDSAEIAKAKAWLTAHDAELKEAKLI